MNAYKVFFTPKPEVDVEEVVSLALSYAELLKKENLIESCELHRITEKGSFGGIAEYMMITYFDSEESMDLAFDVIR